MFTTTIIAVASTNAQTAHACSWRWLTVMGRGPGSSGFAIIDQSDGLPIELLEYSVQD